MISKEIETSWRSETVSECLWRLRLECFGLWMWTPESRGRMAEIARKTKRYPSDLTDEEWGRILQLLPEPPRRGRKVSVDLREMLNAIGYMARSGGGWRTLPTDFGPWQPVYWWFRRFVRRMLFLTIHDVSLMLDGETRGREASRPVACSKARPSKHRTLKFLTTMRTGRSSVASHIAVDTDAGC